MAEQSEEDWTLLNREANTTLSKTSDQEISDKAIELKTDIEKVREQIQNIE